MAGESVVTLTIAFNDPDQDIEEIDEDIRQLLGQLSELDEVEVASRVIDRKPPKGNKAIGGFLVGLLTTEVRKENLKKVFAFLSERLGSKPIKLKVKAPDGREIELEASSQQEFDFAYQRAQDFLKGN